MANIKRVAAGSSAAKRSTDKPTSSSYFDIVRSLSADPELQKAVDVAEERDKSKKKR